MFVVGFITGALLGGASGLFCGALLVKCWLRQACPALSDKESLAQSPGLCKLRQSEPEATKQQRKACLYGPGQSDKRIEGQN